tara:strand:+ start:1593 stop:2741 length:1149 start_codon:yes stop_codon:yes gene_type:complete
MEMFETPKLYATSSKGELKTWEAHVGPCSTGTSVTFTFGMQKGKKQVQRKVITEGKNVGRSNETTHFQQAVKEVQSKMQKKMDSGYTPDKENIKTPILPMLAHVFEKRKQNIKYPAYVQPKVDGVRMVCSVDNGKIKMFTRKGKEFTKLAHLEEELLQYFHRISRYATNEFYLDGELYSDTLTFQEVAGAVRRKENSPEILTQIKYVIFDCFNTRYLENLTFEERWENILGTKPDIRFDNFKYIKPIRTFLVSNDIQVKEFNQSYCLPNGYEGAMIRNASGLYKLNHRSADLQKLKQFQDNEFEITGYKQGTGSEEGCIIYQCATEDGAVFFVRPKGSLNWRIKMFKEAKKFIGQQLTVRFQELTDDGIPRFPVGISVRNYE